MTGDRAQARTQQPEGIAGYVTPYPYLDQLQEKMEERLARKVPIKGRFCGFCYARLRESDTVCPFCASAIVGQCRYTQRRSSMRISRIVRMAAR